MEAVQVNTNEAMARGSTEWYQKVIASRMKYETLREWQVKLAQDIRKGVDVVCIAPTGSGKSALLHIPLHAAKEEKGRVLGLSIAPTKSLCDDQVRAASDRGLSAIALYHDEVRAATRNDRNLFNEAFDKDMWDLVVLPPEMLTSPAVDQFFQSQSNPRSKKAKLDMVFIDECHLVREHGKDFRKDYARIGRLRGRIPSLIPWVAVTATLPPGDYTQEVLASLGFGAGTYTEERRRVDVPNIKYIPRFVQHSLSGPVFLDLSWIIPVGTTSRGSIKKTIVFCETIKRACGVVDFLDSLVPDSINSREDVIMPFYSLLTSEYRKEYLKSYQDGHVRVVVGTDTITCGVDVSDIEQVVIFGRPSTIERMSQQIGRAGRNQKPARAIVYTSDRSQSNDDGDDTDDSPLSCWVNATVEHCPRQVFCDHYGDEFLVVNHCCSLHEPDDGEDERMVKSWEAVLSRKSRRTQAERLPHKLEKSQMYPAALRMLFTWVRHHWKMVRDEDDSFSPADYLLSKQQRETICNRIYTITSVAKLKATIGEWEYMAEKGQALVDFCVAMCGEFDELIAEREAAEEDLEELAEAAGTKLLLKIPSTSN